MDSVGCFFFALISSLRYEINIGFFERPLVVGVVWATVTGQWEVTMALAVFYELFWLDLFPVGTYIPPNASISFLLGLVAAHRFGLSQPSALVVPVLLSLPAALSSAQFESFLRRVGNKRYDRLLEWSSSDAEDSCFAVPALPSRLVTGGVLLHALAHGSFFLVWSLVLDITMQVLGGSAEKIPHVSGITWEAFWFVGALGGLLALRIKRAFFVYGAVIAAGVLLSFFYVL